MVVDVGHRWSPPRGARRCGLRSDLMGGDEALKEGKVGCCGFGVWEYLFMNSDHSTSMLEHFGCKHIITVCII